MIAALSVLLVSSAALPVKARRVKWLGIVAACLALFEAASMSVALLSGLPSHVAVVVEVKCNHIPPSTFEWAQSQAALFHTNYISGLESEDRPTHEEHPHHHEAHGVVWINSFAPVTTSAAPPVKMLDPLHSRLVEPIIELAPPTHEHHEQSHFCHGVGRFVHRFGVAFLVMAFIIKALLTFTALTLVKHAALLQATYTATFGNPTRPTLTKG